MSGQITRRATDSRPPVRPDEPGFRPTHPKQPYPDIPADDPSFNDPGLTGGPTTESIPARPTISRSICWVAVINRSWLRCPRLAMAARPSFLADHGKRGANVPDNH